MKINISIIDEATGAGTSESFDSLEAAQVYIGKKLGLIPEGGLDAEQITVEDEATSTESAATSDEEAKTNPEAPTEEAKEEVSAE